MFNATIILSKDLVNYASLSKVAKKKKLYNCGNIAGSLASSNVNMLIFMLTAQLNAKLNFALLHLAVIKRSALKR